MKILMVTHWGAEFGIYDIVRPSRYYSLANQIAALGHTVCLLYAGGMLDKVIPPYLNVRWHGGPARFLHDNLSIIILPPYQRGTHVKYYYGGLQKIAVSLKDLMQGFDIVHVSYLFDLPVGLMALVSKYSGKRSLIMDWVDLSPRIHQMGLRWSWIRWFRLLPTWATVGSEYLKKQLILQGFDERMILKLPMGVDPSSFTLMDEQSAKDRLGISSDELLIGYESGSGMHPDYIDLILHSFRVVAHNKPRVKIAFIGDFETGGWHYKIMRGAKRLGVDDRILITGRLSMRELHTWLCACSVLLLPMVDTPYDWARFPGRLTDYLAAGKPIVGTDIGEVAEVLRQGCGLLSAPSDYLSFAHNIIKLIEDETLREKMGKISRELAEKEYSWQTLSKKLERFYKRIERN